MPDKMKITTVIKYSNGIVLVFDQNGEQMPDYQGRYSDVKDRILADAPESAEFRVSKNLSSI